MDAKDTVVNITLEYLQSTPAGEALQACLDELEKAEAALNALASGTEDPSLTLLKMASVLSAAVFRSMAGTGRMPGEFDEETWAGIANEVVDVAVLMDGQTYTERVFNAYACLIDLSVERWKGVLAKDAIDSVMQVSAALKDLSADLEAGSISEPDYVEQCLWLCLEAMVKLLAAYQTRKLDDDDGRGVLLRAIADFAVQYTRLAMYEQERVLLDEYLRHQGVLDHELQAKLDEYVEELGARSAVFSRLIDDAFSPDFQSALRASASFAAAAGVPKEQILDSPEKVDDYFL